MAVSPGYQTFVLDQLRRALPDVRGRRMFGGVGLYANDLFFALIDDDVLYLKVDDTNRPDFEARGMKIFQPFGEGTATMQYYTLPEEILEDAPELRVWAERALDVAHRAKRSKARPAKAAKAAKAAKRKTPVKAPKPARGSSGKRGGAATKKAATKRAPKKR